MLIVAKYPSKCPICGQSIVTGERVHWQKGEKPIHALCKPTERSPTAKERTLSLFDHKDDTERKPWEGRDGSLATRSKKPKVFKPLEEFPEWKPNRFPPGIPDSWVCREARIDWEKSSGQFHVYVVNVHLHTSETLAQAITFAERHLKDDLSTLDYF